MSQITKKSYNKKPDPNTKAGKVFLLQQQGLTDTQVARRLDITPENIPNMEATNTYKAFQKKFSDTLLEKISMEQIANKVKKNILQDSDKGASNTAIFKALERIEPDTMQQQAQMVNIVLKSPDNPK